MNTLRLPPPGFVPLDMGGEFIAHNGPMYIRHSPQYDGGQVKLGFRVEARHSNALGICHGGMMASFCDMLLPVTAHRLSGEPGDRFLPTISLQIDYLAATPQGAWVEGQAEVLRNTGSLLFVQGLVTADGEPVARVSGIFRRGQVLTLAELAQRRAAQGL